MNNYLYPITIIMDRYSGIYSGGAFLAFNLDYDEIPQEINQDDVTCMNFWSTNKNMIVGRGATPQEAYENLYYETVIKCNLEAKENET